MTGLTNKMRANFRIMKAIARTTKPDANKRLQNCQELAKKLNG